MAANTQRPTRGITFVDGLQLLFIGLKLVGAIDWPWWAVLAPLWLSLTIYVLVELLK